MLRKDGVLSTVQFEPSRWWIQESDFLVAQDIKELDLATLLRDLEKM